MEPVTIYMVTSGASPDDFSVECLFSSRDQAQAFIDAHDSLDASIMGCDIEEWILDQNANAEKRQVWAFDVYQDGSELGDASLRSMVKSPMMEIVGPAYYRTSMYMRRTGHWVFRGVSAVSLEHARDVAIKARQKWLLANSVAPEHSGAPESKGGA